MDLGSTWTYQWAIGTVIARLRQNCAKPFFGEACDAHVEPGNPYLVVWIGGSDSDLNRSLILVEGI